MSSHAKPGASCPPVGAGLGLGTGRMLSSLRHWCPRVPVHLGMFRSSSYPVTGFPRSSSKPPLGTSAQRRAQLPATFLPDSECQQLALGLHASCPLKKALRPPRSKDSLTPPEARGTGVPSQQDSRMAGLSPNSGQAKPLKGTLMSHFRGCGLHSQLLHTWKAADGSTARGSLPPTWETQPNQSWGRTSGWNISLCLGICKCPFSEATNKPPLAPGPQQEA